MRERPGADPARIAGAARAAFVARITPLFEGLAGAIDAHLNSLADRVAPLTVMQKRRDDAVLFGQSRTAWVEGLRKAWAQPAPRPDAPATPARPVDLALIDDAAVENRIQASRLSLLIEDAAGGVLRDLRLRLRALEPGRETDARDPLHPDRLAGLLVDGWVAAGLSRSMWVELMPVIRPQLVEAVAAAYREINQMLEAQGIEARPEARPAGARAMAAAPQPGPRDPATPRGGPAGGADSARMLASHPASPGTGRTASGREGRSGAGPGASAGRPGSSDGFPATTLAPRSGSAPGTGPGGASPGAAAWPGAGGSPAAAGKGLFGQLRDILGGRPSSASAPRGRTELSPRLERAMRDSRLLPPGPAPGQRVGEPELRQASAELRERVSDLKGQAEHASERALIEIVALMFQSILAEERIPASIRVWFARLQMPVLRVALAEPEFFESLEHPACRLIDRMGSCVMGFEPQSVEGGALEAEIRRIVQTIEQYPDTADEAFGVLLGEFERFLKSFLTGKESMRQLVSVAQQVELMETQVVRYTIEMRKMLESAPVPDVVREFLFKVWVEVLAMADVKLGPTDPQTASLRQVAADLLNAASPKPKRQDRAQVIQDLPDLLQRLRQGMVLRGLDAHQQDEHIRHISATLADAFMSRTRVIPAEDIRELGRRLALIETVAAGDGGGSLVFEAQGLRRLVGDTERPIEVLVDVDGTPSDGRKADLTRLHPGDWFVLDHNGKVVQVQYLWRSQHGHLHLMASVDGACFLFQAGRLAAYLATGLIMPADAEPLTFRAARQALAKIEANPERLHR